MHGSDAIRAIKERINIVTLIGRYVELKRNGTRFVAPCPFHHETKPSFSVNEELGSYYCFGCQAKGDIFTFYSTINGVDFRTALEELAKEAGVPLDAWATPKELEEHKRARAERTDMLALSTFAQRYFASVLASPLGEKCRNYLTKRGVSHEIIGQFGLGFADYGWEGLKNALIKQHLSLELATAAGLLGCARTGRVYDRFRGRLIFPITTFPKQVIAFGGRIIDNVDEAKYINSAESPIYKKGEHLFGLVEAAPAIRNKGFALLTEGYLDVLTLHQFGFTNAVGVLGTALTHNQIQRLTQSFTQHIVLVFDGDSAGRKAALRACEMILPLGLTCRVLLLPDPEDCDSLLRTPNGPTIFADLLQNATQGLTFYAKTLRTLAPREMVAKAQTFLGAVQLPELYTVFATKLAHLLGISEEELRKSMAALRKPNAPATPERLSSEKPLVAGLYTILESEILQLAARYPEQMDLIADTGADIFLRSKASQAFWTKLLDRDHCTLLFNETEQRLWQQWRGKFAPPANDFDLEFAALKQSLEVFMTYEDQAVVTQAMRFDNQKDDFAADLIYLRALQQTLVEHTHEQS